MNRTRNEDPNRWLLRVVTVLGIATLTACPPQEERHTPTDREPPARETMGPVGDPLNGETAPIGSPGQAEESEGTDRP